MFIPPYTIIYSSKKNKLLLPCKITRQMVLLFHSKNFNHLTAISTPDVVGRRIAGNKVAASSRSFTIKLK
jgi:hypothetical protein